MTVSEATTNQLYLKVDPSFEEESWPNSSDTVFATYFLANPNLLYQSCPDRQMKKPKLQDIHDARV